MTNPKYTNLSHIGVWSHALRCMRARLELLDGAKLEWTTIESKGRKGQKGDPG
jgi:hypothetical protein